MGHTAAVQGRLPVRDGAITSLTINHDIIPHVCGLNHSLSVLFVCSGQHELHHLFFLWVQATGSWDRTVRLWKLHEEKELVMLKEHQMNVTCVCFSGHKDSAYSCVHFWWGASHQRI